VQLIFAFIIITLNQDIYSKYYIILHL
jgi:hypothetical protein